MTKTELMQLSQLELAEMVLVKQREVDELVAHVQKLEPLAYRTLWISYVWNDHNFKHPFEIAREQCKELGIKDFDEANKFLVNPPQTSLAEHDAEVAKKAYEHGFQDSWYGDDEDGVWMGNPITLSKEKAKEYADKVKRGEVD